MKKNPPMHLTDPEAIKARSRRARALKKTLKKNSEIENLLLDVDVLGMAVHLPHRLGGNGPATLFVHYVALPCLTSYNCCTSFP